MYQVYNVVKRKGKTLRKTKKVQTLKKSTSFQHAYIINDVITVGIGRYLPLAFFKTIKVKLTFCFPQRLLKKVKL